MNVDAGTGPLTGRGRARLWQDRDARRPWDAASHDPCHARDATSAIGFPL